MDKVRIHPSWCFALLVTILVSTFGIAHAVDAESASVRVIDGDTLDLDGVRIRLHGIDAPEGRQTCSRGGATWLCGQEASRALRQRIQGQALECEQKDRDGYGRIVGVCRANGEDLNAWMVSEGWALAYRQYSTDYVAQEAQATAARRGLWAGEFTAPWDWRRGLRKPSPSTQSVPANDNCAIKGNINSKGQKIYHVPGGRSYAATRIDTRRGERWFCSRDEASVAGWTPAKQ